MDRKIYAKINLDELSIIAKKLASKLKNGDVILLKGDLGAGKTTFTQLILKHLNYVGADMVTSPTFNMVNIYNLDLFDIWHFDLYRLKNIYDIYELGIEDALNNAVSIIEWPEMIEKILPSSRIEVKIDYTDDQDVRNIEILYDMR